MKNLIHKILISLTLMCPLVAHAGYYRIVNIKEDYRKVYTTQPQEICEYRNHRNDGVAGAVIGGVIGNRFGRGDGRAAFTIGGAWAGYRIANRHSEPRYNCRIEYIRTYQYVTAGYIIYYDYHGSLRSTYMTDYPRGYEIYIPL